MNGQHRYRVSVFGPIKRVGFVFSPECNCAESFFSIVHYLSSLEPQEATAAFAESIVPIVISRSLLLRARTGILQ
ncbi:hypothetical protein L6164_007638 [Bauhinia variegata]|uniref:Uncharacterized protein n=1 Tax=Bauhinia variegata TaxID=167791 RepID=A0ACB9PE16_BAUVA|nr:hypothetical protein L6164_007638 [Bauhinia variegata]